MKQNGGSNATDLTVLVGIVIFGAQRQPALQTALTNSNR